MPSHQNSSYMSSALSTSFSFLSFLFELSSIPDKTRLYLSHDGDSRFFFNVSSFLRLLVGQERLVLHRTSDSSLVFLERVTRVTNYI